MIIPLLIFFGKAREIVYYRELEKRSADSICQNYQASYSWTKPNQCYVPGKDCEYGEHNQEDMEWTAKRVNFFRQIVGLNEIPQSTNTELLNQTNQACLIMDKNSIFDHDLNNKSLKCWNEAGKTGAENSNIYVTSGSACSTDSIPSYIDDSSTSSLGHRRWILNPPLSEVVSGVGEKHSALLIKGMPQKSSVISKFLAYPPPGPVPSDIIYSNWSFSRNYTEVNSDQHNKMPKDTIVRIKCNKSVISVSTTLLDSNPSMYPGIIKFDVPKINAGTYCKVVISSDSADIEWRYTVQAIKCVNGKAENVNPDAFNDNDYNFDEGGKKKKGLSIAAKVGIVVAVVVVAGVIIFVWIMFKAKLDHLC